MSKKLQGNINDVYVEFQQPHCLVLRRSQKKMTQISIDTLYLIKPSSKSEQSTLFFGCVLLMWSCPSWCIPLVWESIRVRSFHTVRLEMIGAAACTKGFYNLNLLIIFTWNCQNWMTYIVGAPQNIWRTSRLHNALDAILIKKKNMKRIVETARKRT